MLGFLLIILNQQHYPLLEEVQAQWENQFILSSIAYFMWRRKQAEAS